MGPLRTFWDWCSLGEPFSPSQVDPRELGAGGDLAERLQDTHGPGHSKYTETLPAQVGVPGGYSTAQAAPGAPAVHKPKVNIWSYGDMRTQVSVSFHPRK